MLNIAFNIDLDESLLNNIKWEEVLTELLEHIKVISSNNYSVEEIPLRYIAESTF
jgi:hypothetical protein